MDEEYDVIILGTGLKECVLSGVLSVEGKKVLHIDRNGYYGGECASLNITQLYEKFFPGKTPDNKLGHNRDYNVDLVPKFLMSTGVLVKLLLKTGVTKYLEFQSVQGSYVYKDKKIHKVPCSKSEALSSSLMGMFEKKRFADLIGFVNDYDESKKKDFDAKTQPMSKLFDKFGVDENTQSFLGHAIALHTTDDYKTQPAFETMDRMCLYRDSVAQYQGQSPYIYPRYGLGELPQAFARLAAIYGGTYMLQKPVEEIVYGADGKACGVKSEGEVAKCKFVVGDPSYFQDKVKKTGRVIRVICILNHPIHNTGKPPANSLQIILPQREISKEKKIQRKNDIYVACMSGEHCVVPQGKYLAIVSANVETDNPEEEIAPALKLLGDIEEKFTVIDDVYEPTSDGSSDACFISKSYDGSSHFESTSADILDIYKRITGKDMDMTPMPQEE